MKLTTYNPTVLPKISGRGEPSLPLIGFNAKTGQFRFNKIAVAKIGLTDGCNIVLHQDDEEPKDWYLEKVKDDGFKMLARENVSPGGLVISNIQLAKKIMDSCNCSAISGHLQVGPEPVKNGKQILWPLFTGKLL